MYLHMATREGRGPKGFLRLIHWLPLWHAQDESSLVIGGRCGSYPVTGLPSPMDAFTWVQEIQLYNLKVTERSPVNIHTANAGKLRGT
jgi:hypothetical protein